MTIDWLSGLVCGFVAAWFFLRGSSAGQASRGGSGFTPFDPRQRRPDPPSVPPKPTPPPLRTYRDGDAEPQPLVADVVSYCAVRGRGVFLVTPRDGVALPYDNGRC